MPILPMLLVLAAPAPLVSPIAPAPSRSQPAASTMQPATNPGSWATNEDYPPEAMRDEREGTSGFRLMIAPSGLPRTCEIISSSGHADLDATTCRLLMERARFRPGRDAAGRPVGGTYSNRIRWQIPDGDWPAQVAGFEVDTERDSWPRGPVADPAMSSIDPAAHYPAPALASRREGDVQMALGVDAEGKVTSCTIIRSSFVADLDAAACAVMRSEGKFRPALDSSGKPTKGVIPARFNWVLPRNGVTGIDDVLPPPARKFPMDEAGSAVMTVLVGADGKVADCKFVGTGTGPGRIPSGVDPCAEVAGDVQYIPFVDANGRPVARRLILRSELAIEDAGTPKGQPGE